MKRIPLSKQEDHPELEQIANLIKSRRYFNKIPRPLIIEMLRHGEMISLNGEEYISREGEPMIPEMYLLLEGSVAVSSRGEFIMRLDQAGDVMGELSVVSPGSRALTDVLTETTTRLIVFPVSLFHTEDSVTHVSALYLTLTHILGEKMRVFTAQTALNRPSAATQRQGTPQIAIIDQHGADRRIIRGTLGVTWEFLEVTEFEDTQKFLEDLPSEKFDLIIIDPKHENGQPRDRDSLRLLVDGLKIYMAPILVIGDLCNEESTCEFLEKIGVSGFLAKPYSSFDLKHLLSGFKVAHYRERELERVEHAADTDRLTNLANRRRMDAFIEALVTLYPDEKNPFSFIISDVDNFKHYNDTHGHQMGDVVLSTVAGVFKHNVRRGDLAARFGGEEFVVILPKCGKDAAVKIAEKLRIAIEDEDVPYQDQQPTGNLTVTIGVATYPEDADTVDGLLKKADDCLYVGKESGRNKVVAATPG